MSVFIFSFQNLNRSVVLCNRFYGTWLVIVYLFYHSIFTGANLCITCPAGFLPEEWDSFLVNTLYPSFTPTVGLFLLGAAGYGVVKYLGAGPPKE